jgi:uncharacterized protein YqeY
MSEIIKKLDEDIKNALRARDQARLDSVRLIKTAVKNKEIELIHPLSEQEFFAVLATMAKQRKDSVEQYEKAGRMDLAAKEKSELEIIQGYLPQQLGENELKSLVAAAIQKTGAAGPKDMGKVMGELKSKTSGRVDGKWLADMVKNMLAGS